MKTEKQSRKLSGEKSTIEQLREIRDKISMDIKDMTFEQLQKYIEQRLTETLHPSAVWRKRRDIA